MWGGLAGLGYGNLADANALMVQQQMAASNNSSDQMLAQMQAQAQLEQLRQQLASQQGINQANNANSLQLAGLNNANALNIAGVNNQSNNTLAGLAQQKQNLGLSLLGLLSGGQGGGGQSAVNLGPRPSLPSIVGTDLSGRPATAANMRANQQWAESQNAFSAALAAQQAWDQQNAARQASQGGGGSGLGGLGQAIAGSGFGGGLGGDAQQLVALGLIDPQLASVLGQQNVAAMNNANNLDVTRLNNANVLANTGLNNANNLDVTRLNNENQLANTGLQTRGALDLAGVNNAADLEQLMRSLTSQERIAGLNNANALEVAGINTAPALQAQQLARDAFSGRQNLLQQILGAGGGLGGLFGEPTGDSPLMVAQGGSSNGDVSSQYLQQLIAGADDQFTAMPQELFQQQLNQILGNSASALGGQLRSAQGAAGGAGMGANSPVARALQNQYGNAANASVQNSLTNAFLGKYNTDFQRQQAQAGYRQGLGQLALGQTTQNQNYGLGLGNLQLGSLQNSTTRRGQNLGLIGQLTA